MAVVQERTKEVVQAYRRHASDTGSPEVQVALITNRIGYLTEHFKVHRRTTTPVVGCSSSWDSVAACSTTSRDATSSVTRA